MKKIYLSLFILSFYLFSYSQNYTILGNASPVGGCNCFRITPDANDQGGAIYQNQTINLNNSFDFSFNVFLGCNGSSGADGIVFVLTSNPNGLGAFGGGLGYSGSNQPYSLAVEFDTWENTSVGDPSYDHIAIQSGGLITHNVAGAVPALASQGNIDNCQWHTVRIVWDVNTNTYSVYFDGALRQQIVIPNMVNTYFGGNPIVNWGWSGATGGGTNDQQVCVTNTSSWVAGVNYQTCNLTVQFQDISTSSLGSVQSWAWTFGDGGTSSQQNPTHTYAGTGTYSVTLTITDISGCTNTYTNPVTINPPIAISANITPPPCNGGSNGSITASSSGGFGPAAGYGGYMYEWNNGTTQPSLVGASAGTYTLTVTDGVCTATGQYTVNQPAALTAVTSHTDAPCGGNGTATITISGGTPPYTGVNWAGTPATSGVPVSMPAGMWIADFRDANGCSALLQYRETISQLPCGITTNLTTTNVTCFNGSNGTATMVVTGGSGGSIAGWTASGNTFTKTGLAAGTYNYNYVGVNPAHSFSFTVTITAPGAAITASLATVNMSCANTNDGQALASVNSGGVPPYNYTWTPARPNNAVATNLPAGAVSVTITDVNGCTASASGTITGPPTLTLNVTSVDDSCYQTRLGSATANASGGNPPYLYYWSNISSAQTNLNLGIGTYTVTVTDDEGCTITGSATINEPTALTHTVSANNVSSSCTDDGSILVTASGGTPNYSYSWSPSTASGNNPTGLAAGQYNLTLSDANNCQLFDTITLTAPPGGFTVTASHTDVSCYGGSDGTLTINISGGVPPYSYMGFPVPAGTTVIQNLPAGPYGGGVSDGTGCVITVFETISQPAPQSLAFTSVVNNTCNGAQSGEITVNFMNATGTVIYDWNPGGVLPPARTGLAEGTYSVTATDDVGCTVAGDTTLTDPPAAVLPITVVDAVCFGDSGMATANPTGTSPFTFVWSSGSGNVQTVSLPAGNYTVNATDVNLCNQTASFTINQPTGMTLNRTQTNLLCYGDANGSINFAPTGGTGSNYTYIWNPNVSSSNSASSLTAGTYYVTVTDAASCSQIDTVIIVQPSQLTINIQSSNITCYGLNNGSINVTPSGGTGNYTFTWIPNVSSTNIATGLSPGNYAITVRDSNNCSTGANISISQPTQPLTLTPDSTNLTCYQSNDGTASVAVTGGTFPYSYLWSPNTNDTTHSVTGLSANIYSVTITDRNSCENSISFNITQPAELLATETHADISCYGESTGAVYVTASGGTGNFSYSWNPNVSAVDSAVNILADIYTITVTDSSGCSVSLTSIVSQPTELTLIPSVTNVTCNGDNDGTVIINATGGVSPYSYEWSPNTSDVTSTVTSLAAGVYNITVTDQNSCTATASATVTEPLLLSSTVNTIDVTCYNFDNGSITVLPSGGTLPYTISLSGINNPSGMFTGLSAGTYPITIEDANGCTISESATITEPDSLLLSISPTPVEVKLGSTLQLTTTTNQSGAITYNWQPDFGLDCYDCPNPVFSGLYSQTYTLSIVNQNGCTGSSVFEVRVIPNYDIFIPNVFAPNGSGANATWHIFGNLTAIKQLDIKVFNRWGEKVFESNDINFQWDGTYKGQPAPAGVYVYTAKFVWLDNHSDNGYSGSVTILK